MNWIRTSVLIIILFITYMSLKAPAGGIEIHVNDKIGHALAYCVLTINLGLLFSKKQCYLAAMFAFSYSCLLEHLQGFIPGRTVSIYDLYANATGAMIGCLVLILLHGMIIQFLRKLKVI